MESWMIAFVVTIAFWLAQAILSLKERTFSYRQLVNRGICVFSHGRYRWQHLPMSFLNNWAVSIGDLVLFPIINALVVSHLWPMMGWQWKYFACFIIGIGVSGIFHQAWWGHDEHLGHVFTGWNRGYSYKTIGGVGHNNFYDDITQAGWVHFWFMSFQVAIVLAFIFTPMPGVVVLWVSGLLALFFAIQNVQAVMIQRSKAFIFFPITLVELSALCVLVMFKTII